MYIIKNNIVKQKGYGCKWYIIIPIVVNSIDTYYSDQRVLSHLTIGG